MPPKRGKKRAPTKRVRARKDGNSREADPRVVSRGLPGGFGSVRLRTVAQPDSVIVKLRYETTSAFTSTGGAASYVQIKGNSTYRPYSGNTDSVGGYSRMYADYEYATVLKASIKIRLWGGVAGQDEPFRLVVVPCTSAQYAVYSAFSNVAQLWDVPHARQSLFSPGGVLPTLTSWGTTQSIIFGNSEEKGQEMTAGSLATYASTTGVDPATLWYFLIGYQNMAGTTTTNQQAQVSIEYIVRWFRPVATPVQVTNKHGNEEVPTAGATARSGVEYKGPSQVGAGLSLSSTAPVKTQEEAFEEWSDVDSEYSAFKAFCDSKRRAIRREEQKTATASSKPDPG